MRCLLWFKEDLRLDDNPALLLATGADCLLPVYILDPQRLQVGTFGARRLGVHRARFLLESLAALDSALRQQGSRLLVLQGKAEQLIAGLVQHFDLQQVITSEEIVPEERAQVARVRSSLGAVPLIEAPGNGLFQAGELPGDLSQLPGVYSAFCTWVDARPAIFQPRPAPERLPPLPEYSENEFEAIPNLSQLGLGEPLPAANSAFPFSGGESAGQARLRDYLWAGMTVRDYCRTRNQLIGSEYSSKFSPWLANGSLSVQRVAAELRRHEGQYGRNDSTQALWGALLWREFLRWTLVRRGAALFRADGTAATRRAPSGADERFLHWCAGRTGLPLVDANMRELSATGFMSSRGRQIVASYLIGELQQDWRHGAAWFEEHLLDHEPASNWGNWVYLAGICSDPQRRHEFNALRQARRYDPQADYVSLWLPELQEVPQALRHTPFLLSAEQRDALVYPQLQQIPATWTPYLPVAVA